MMRLHHNEVRSMSELSEAQVQQIVERAIDSAFDRLGFDHETPADMRHIRRWRLSTEKAVSVTFLTAIGILTTGFLGALWLGFKSMMGAQ